MRKELAPLPGLGEYLRAEGDPVGPAGAEQPARPWVDGQPDRGAEQGFPGQPVGEQECYVHPFLQLEGLRGDPVRGHRLLEDTAGQLLLRREVEVERTPCETGPVEDRGDRGGVVTVLVEDLGGGFQEDSARADRPLLSCQLALPLNVA